MPHPTARVLALLELLQAHGRMSGAELARRLGVDVRTLRRYIVTLETLGIPITAERGRHGAYSLVTGFKLPPLMFTDDESLAISLGLRAAHSLGLADAAPAVASAQAKLERVMPAKLKTRARAVSETTTLDLSRSVTPQDNAALLAMASAAQQRQRVRFRYRSRAGESSERAFDPYGLVFREGSWYVAGYCHLRAALRSFRLDRVRELQVLANTFARPADFDALKHLTFSIASIPRAHAVQILLHTDLATALAYLPPDLGLFEPANDGVLFRAHTDSIDWFARQLARLPFRFEIRAPRELRAALQRHAAQLLKDIRADEA